MSLQHHFAVKSLSISFFFCQLSLAVITMPQSSSSLPLHGDPWSNRFFNQTMTWLLLKCLTWMRIGLSLDRKRLCELSKNQSPLWQSCAVLSWSLSKIGWRATLHCFYVRQMNTNEIKLLQRCVAMMFCKTGHKSSKAGISIQKELKRGEGKPKETSGTYLFPHRAGW